MALGLVATMLMSNATTVLADGDEKKISAWQADNSSLFGEEDYEKQRGDDDSWKQNDNAENTFVNTTTTTNLTVDLQGNATLNGVKVDVYQIMEITGDAGTGEGYSYAVTNESLRTFLASYFATGEDDSSILQGLESLDTQEAKNAFSVALAQYIEDEEISPAKTHTGTESEKSYTFDLSRQYTYTDGDTDTHEYTLGKGYYFITRTDAIDDTYTLRVLDAKDTTITLKGTKPSLSKSGDDVVMAVGDTVNYTLQSKLTYSKGTQSISILFMTI